MTSRIYRDPFEICAENEEQFLKRARDCAGCCHLLTTRVDEKLLLACSTGRRVGTKCPAYAEAE